MIGIITCNETQFLSTANSFAQVSFSRFKLTAIDIHRPYAAPCVRHFTYASPNLPTVNSVRFLGEDMNLNF